MATRFVRWATSHPILSGILVVIFFMATIDIHAPLRSAAYVIVIGGGGWLLLRRLLKKEQPTGWVELAKKHGIEPTKEMERADRELRELERAEKKEKQRK